MVLQKIPTVDLNLYLHGDASERAAFVKKLGDSFSQIGFAIVANHGVSHDVIDQTYQAFQRFFSLPDASKQRHEIEGLAGQRGYTSKGKEHAKGRNVGDLKEFFHLGQPESVVMSDGEIYPDNIFVPEVPEIESYGMNLFLGLEQAGLHLLKALAEYLHLPNDYFDEKVTGGNSILRPIHYFPIEQPEELPEGAVRAAEHEDISLITLLIGASADGLEVLNTANEWVAAKPQPKEIVVNVGDMLQRLTNRRLKSTTHRVVNPPKEQMHLPRYSMPFFMHPRSDMDLACLESCISDSRPKEFSDMTAGAYLDQRLREIGMKK